MGRSVDKCHNSGCIYVDNVNRWRHCRRRERKLTEFIRAVTRALRVESHLHLDHHLDRTIMQTSTEPIDDQFGLQLAFQNAKRSYAEGGVPIGAALIYHGNDSKYSRVLGVGHNQRIQKSSAILHGETAALEAAGRLKADAYRHSTMVGRLLVNTYGLLNVPAVMGSCIICLSFCSIRL